MEECERGKTSVYLADAICHASCQPRAMIGRFPDSRLNSFGGFKSPLLGIPLVGRPRNSPLSLDKSGLVAIILLQKRG